MHAAIRLRLWSVAGTLVVLLMLVMGGEAPARDDDVVAGADSPARAARGRPSADQPRRSGPFVVSLTNGDRLTGRIVAVDGSRLRFRPDVAGDAEIDLPLPRIDHVDHPRAGDSVEPRGDRLYPLAGGVLYGTLARLGPRSLTLDAHLVGRVELPIDTLAAFVRQGCELQPRAAPPEAYQVQRGSEPPLTGSAGFAAGGVTVTSATGSVTVPLGELDAVLFPDREPAGLLSLESAKRMNQGSFTLLADHPLAAGVGDSFASVNATYEYVTEDPQLEPIATRPGGGAAVLVKRFGRGTLVLLGMDYYASSDAVDRLLVNAATLHRVSP